MPKGPRSKNNDKPICKCRLSISSDLPDGRSRSPVVVERQSWDLRTSPLQDQSSYVLSWSITRRWSVGWVLNQIARASELSRKSCRQKVPELWMIQCDLIRDSELRDGTKPISCRISIPSPRSETNLSWAAKACLFRFKALSLFATRWRVLDILASMSRLNR